jgi:hypothetical protein
MIDYTWQFSNLMVSPNYKGMQDVIVSLQYTLTGVDGDASASVSGSLGLLPPDPQEYTPFADVTKQECQEWVELAMGNALNVYKANIAADIDKQKNPPLVEMAAPWG